MAEVCCTTLLQWHNVHITGSVCSTACPGLQQRKHWIHTLLWGNPQSPMDSTDSKGPVMQEVFPCHENIMNKCIFNNLWFLIKEKVGTITWSKVKTRQLPQSIIDDLFFTSSLQQICDIEQPQCKAIQSQILYCFNNKELEFELLCTEIVQYHIFVVAWWETHFP